MKLIEEMVPNYGRSLKPCFKNCLDFYFGYIGATEDLVAGSNMIRIVCQEDNVGNILWEIYWK